MRFARRARAAVRTQTYESVMTGFNHINAHVFTNPEIGSLLVRGHSEPAELDDNSAIQYSFVMRSYANQWLKMFRLCEDLYRELDRHRPETPISLERLGASQTGETVHGGPESD